MSEPHWHALIGSHLDKEAVQLNATPPLPSAQEAQGRIVHAARFIAEAMPSVAMPVEEIAAMPAEGCHIIIQTAGFTVLPCTGSEESECMVVVDREAEEMVKAYEVKQVIAAVSALSGGLPPEYQQLIKEFVSGATAEPDDGPEPGGYL
jgi:hypothetical protein